MSSLRLGLCRLFSTSLLTFSLFFAVQALAGEGFQPVSPEELKMTAEPQAPGAPAIILYRQVDRDDSGHTPHEFNYIRIKILKEEGRKYADIEIPFYKENGNNLVNVHGRTIRPDGSILDFDGKIFEKTIAKAKGLKYLAKTFTLPDVQVGGVIEYYYTYDFSERYVYDSHWTLVTSCSPDRPSFRSSPTIAPTSISACTGVGRVCPPALFRPPRGRIMLCAWRQQTSPRSRRKTSCLRRMNLRRGSTSPTATCSPNRIRKNSGRRSAAL